METGKLKRRLPGFDPAAATAAALGALVSGAFCCGALPWYFPPAVMAAAFPILRRPKFWALALGAAAVLASHCLQDALAPRPELGERAVFGKMTLRFEDPRVSRLPELSERMRTATAALIRFEPDGGTSTDGRGARVFVRLPRGMTPPVYGTLFAAEGTLTPLAAVRRTGGSFDFPEFLERRGMVAAAQLRSGRATGREPGWRGRLLDARDAMLEKLFDGVADRSSRQLAAALYCGVGSGMPEDLRREFSAAGIVHIFSVSGMHVAVLALFLGALLRVLPYRWRWPLLALAVWGYVLATGAGTPAVRAGTMVTLWCVLRMSLLRVSGFDILCWTAALLLVFDPRLPAFVGAQYSFLITGALLLLAERRRDSRSPDTADLVPFRFRSVRSERSRLLRSRAEMLLTGAATAFLAGAGVSLTSPAHRLMPAAVAANILVSLLMPWYFILFFVQLLMGCFGAGEVTAPLFDSAFALLRHIAAVTRRCSELGVAPPPWPLAVLYTFALLVFLGARSRRARIGAGLTAAVSLLVWMAVPSYLPPALMVRSGDFATLPLIAVAEPERGVAVVIDLPDSEGAAEAAEFLRMRGVNTVEAVGVSVARSGALRGLPALLRELSVKRVRLPEDADGRSRRLREVFRNGVAAKFESERFHHDLFRVARQERGFRLDYFDPGSKLCFGMTVRDTDRGREIALETEHGGATAVLPWSIYPGVWEYEFGKK